MSDQFTSPDVTSDDKLWVLLAYIFSPLVPIILMLMEDKKNRSFIRAHNAQALILGAVNMVIGSVLSVTIIGLCVPAVIWFYMIYLGLQGYNGKYNTIPVITDFCKKQGWA